MRIVPPSDQFVNDKQWVRVELDGEEFYRSLLEDGVRHFIREVLRPRYGTSPLFHSVVDDVTHSVLSLVSARLRQACTHVDIVTLLDETALRKAEKQLEESQRANASLAYYKGEK